MLAGVLEVLTEVEHRDANVIAREVANAAFDLLEFRLVAEQLSSGEIPLKAAPELTAGAFEAVQAAARAAVTPRPHFRQGALPSAVRSFIEDAVLAGTARGSVILRVRPPAIEQPSQVSFEGLEDADSFERRAMNRLLHGMLAAKTATHRDPTSVDLDALDEDVEHGLSANLCEALLKLAGTRTGINASVYVNVRWALTRPANEPVSRVSLDRRELAQLERVAEILKEIEPEPDVTVVGPVTATKREPGDATGTIHIHAELDGRVRTVRVELERSDYDVALQAHTNEQEISVTGTLERTGTTRELVGAKGLAIVD